MIKAWAVVFPDNRIIADSAFKDEDHAWTVALGWPSDKEIEEAKKNGYEAILLTIDINTGYTKPVEHHETGNMNVNAPEGWALLPTELTAENGMKAALMGEFRLRVLESREDGNERIREVTVPWDTIKQIHRAVVAAAPTPPAQEDEPVAEVRLEQGERVVDLTRIMELPIGTKLYARPDDKLRRAAEEIYGKWKAGIIGSNESMIELRAALERKP